MQYENPLYEVYVNYFYGELHSRIPALPLTMFQYICERREEGRVQSHNHIHPFSVTQKMAEYLHIQLLQ